MTYLFYVAHKYLVIEHIWLGCFSLCVISFKTKIEMLQSLTDIKPEMQSDENMLIKIKEEIKVEDLEVAEDIFLYDASFVDSSKPPDYEVGNMLGDFSAGEDPLSLNENPKEDSKEVFIVKPLTKIDNSSKSAIKLDASTMNPLRFNEIDRKIFVCKFCKKKVAKQKHENYIEVEHTYTKVHNFLEMEKTKPLNEQSYPCKFCSSVSKSPRLYMLHLEKHGKEFHECNYCFKNLQINNFLKPLTRFDEYPCELCGKILNKKGSYVAHMGNHYRKQCKFCGKMFPKFARLIAHSVWCKGRTFCSGCSKNFATLDALKNHRLVCEEIQKLNRS